MIRVRFCSDFKDNGRDNFHPHTSAIVTMTTAELVEGSMSYCDETNVND